MTGEGKERERYKKKNLDCKVRGWTEKEQMREKKYCKSKRRKEEESLEREETSLVL